LITYTAYFRIFLEGYPGSNLRELTSLQASKVTVLHSLNHPPYGQAEVSPSLPLRMACV